MNPEERCVRLHRYPTSQIPCPDCVAASLTDPITGEHAATLEEAEAIAATRWIIDHPTPPGRHAT